MLEGGWRKITGFWRNMEAYKQTRLQHKCGDTTHEWICNPDDDTQYRIDYFNRDGEVTHTFVREGANSECIEYDD